jgi:uncharacterized protein (TIGR03437 family)
MFPFGRYLYRAAMKSRPAFNDMKNVSLTIALLTLMPSLALAQPTIASVVNAASFDALMSPGCIVTITGNGLSTTNLSASAPLPITLGGVTVTVNGVAAQLLYVSSTQINLTIPPDLSIPGNVVAPVVVTANGVSSRPYTIRLSRLAPAIFTRDGSPTGKALYFVNGDLGDISAGDAVTIYATGLGATSASDKVIADFEVYLGDRKAQVVSARRAGGIDGSYQIDVLAPVLATDRLYMRAGGWQSNITQVGIRAGANVSNVSGSIDSLYPSNDPNSGATSFALMLHAGAFSANLDVSPSAGAFDIAAVGEAGGAIVSIDPAASCVDDSGRTSKGTYNASMGTVTGSAKQSDFSGWIVPLWDYSTFDAASGAALAFPLSVIPPARLPPFWAIALQRLPIPSVILSAGPNAVLQATGCLAELMPAGGSHLTIDPQHNSIFSVFGGVEQLPLGSAKSRVAIFTLYVDGKKIASKDVAYGVPYKP